MKPRVRKWLESALAAGISGGANALLSAVVSPETININEGFANLCKMAIGGAIFGVALFLKQSPFPPSEPLVKKVPPR